MEKDKFPAFPDSSEPIFSTNVVDIIMIGVLTLFDVKLLLNFF